MTTFHKNDLINPSYYLSARECNRCKHVTEGNSKEAYHNKSQAIKTLQKTLAKAPFKPYVDSDGLTTKEIEALLTEEGLFSDLGHTYKEVKAAFCRLTKLTEKWHWHRGEPWPEDGLEEKVFKAIAFYGTLETDRTDTGYGRFHDSIFLLPTCATNIFFALLPDMLALEEGKKVSQAARAAHEQLCRIGLQAWLYPLRNDHTDAHPISVERFREHIHWVGANALPYRPLFQTAVMLGSVEMMDVVTYLVTHIYSPVSANTEAMAFWQEGLCADGFSWGHGRQTYNTGYPLHSAMEGVRIMGFLKDTPWYEEVSEMDLHWLVGFIRGITWACYEGKDVPMMGRHMYARTPDYDTKEHGTDHAKTMMHQLLTHHRAILGDGPAREFEQILKSGIEAWGRDEEALYQGIRFFWNNDALIQKKKGLYRYINMASSRCDGVECADIMGDTRNFYVADGSYLLMTRGDEYEQVMGTWDVSMLPGVTARVLTNDEILPETNWHGYNSVHNFAGGVSHEDHGLCGFIFEKDGTRRPDGAGHIEENFTEEMLGVLAYKGYFIFGDTLICLGAGIEDKKPGFGRSIRTTVDHTLWHFEVTRTEEGYIHHGHNLYGHCEGYERLITKTLKKKTDWASRNFKNSQVEDKVCPVLHIYTDHGAGPKDGAYGYFVYSGPLSGAAYAQWMPRVVANTKEVQAVESSDGRMVQMIGYKGGATCHFTRFDLTVQEASVLMIEEEESHYRVTVSDPEQNPKRQQADITLRVGDMSLHITVPLPSGHDCGKQSVVTIKKGGM